MTATRLRHATAVVLASYVLIAVPLSAPGAPGDLDSAFGTGGKVTTAFGRSDDFGRATAVQPDGKIVVAGFCFVGSAYDFCLTRYNEDGSLDATFDADGVVTTAVGPGYDYAEAVAIQGDGKIVAAGYCAVGSTRDFCLARYNADGSLDSTFDADGTVTTPIGPGDAIAEAVAIQGDGKIVAAGYCAAGATRDFCLARYDIDGSLDNSFDTDGTVTTAIVAGSDYAMAVAIQSDAKIVAAGPCSVGSTDDFCLARYTTNGSLDSSFDTDGMVTSAIGTGRDVAEALGIQSDGKLVVAGACVMGTATDFCVARFDGNGSLDGTFDGDGKVTTAIGTGDDAAAALAVQGDGKIVAAGQCLTFCLVRYNGDGSLDTSFDGDGKVTTVIGTWAGYAGGVAVAGGGKIVAAGTCSGGVTVVGSTFDYCVARYNSDGSLDTAFDTDGKITTAIAKSDDSAAAIAIQGDGRIVAAGYCAAGPAVDFCLARYNGNGTLDTSFDTDGKVTTAVGAGGDHATAAALQADGKIVAAGYCSIGAAYDFCLARYNTNGSLDSTFGTYGTVTTAISAGGDTAEAVAVQDDGKIVAAGTCAGGSASDFCLARYHGDGGLDSSFDTDGKVTTAVGTGSDYLQAIAIQGDGKIVAAGYCATGSTTGFCLARYNADGSLDASFDTDGKVTTSIGMVFAYARAVAIQGDGRIVAAGECFVGSTDFCLARYNGDGSLDTSFDTDGKVTTAIGSEPDRATAVAVRADGRIVAAGYCFIGSSMDFCLARYAADGSLDPSFNTDGKVTTAIGSGEDFATAVAVQGDGKILAAGACFVYSDSDVCLARYDDIPPLSFDLTVTRDGTGFGTVTGTGISCGADCVEAYSSGTPVTLTATAAAGSIFAGWSGCDSSTGGSCTVSMTAGKTVTATFSATPTFADVPPSNPFYTFIERLFDLGITTGCGTNASSQLIYCPTDPVPRQQMAAFLVRAKGLTQLNSPVPTFADVPASNPFYGYIERLFQTGITTGCGTNASSQLIFCPGEFVPRQQMAAFLVRAKGLTQLNRPVPTFADVPASNPFYGYIERLFETGITTGCGFNASAQRIYCPSENVPRQQMAAFLVRAFD